MNDKTTQAEGEKSAVRTLGRASTILTVGFILVAATGLITWIYSSEPQATREGVTKQTAMLVDVQRVQRGTFIPRITGLGTVAAARDIVLSPRIVGRVIGIADHFLPGDYVERGEVLVTIDPADYEIAVRQRVSELQQAKSALDVELGRRDVAKQEYAMLGQNLSAANKALVLREPQLAAARAVIGSAEATLDQAQLDLQRTRIAAPFNAQILTRNANVGSQVEPGMNLARLVGIDEYWVIVTVPVAQLAWIAFPQNTELGAPVRIRNRAAWPDNTYREGRVRRLIGTLDERTRLARVLVSVQDPLTLQTTTRGPKMILGSIVQAEIEGRPLNNVFRINRDYLRENNTLWIKNDGKLQIQDATVVFKDNQYAYIAEGLRDDDQLVTSNLATVAQDIPLRTAQEPIARTTQDSQETFE